MIATALGYLAALGGLVLAYLLNDGLLALSTLSAVVANLIGDYI